MKRSLVFAIVSVFILTGVTKTFAQENGNRDANGKVVRGPYETNKFGDNWFIEAGAGAGMYLGGNNADFGKRIGTALNFGFGKWITPSLGLRASFDYHLKDKEIAYAKEFKFDFWEAHVDLLWNLSNALGGYKETRVYQLIPYVGAGYGQLTNSNYFDGAAKAFMLNAGFINKFRVSNRVDINLELKSAFATHRFDQMISKRSVVDVPVSINAGITIKLGKTNFSRVKAQDNSAEVAAAVEAALKAKNAELESALANNKNLSDEIEALKKQSDLAPVTKLSYGDIPSDGVIFFPIGKSTLDSKEQVHIAIFAYYIKQLIASGKSFTLVGSANKDSASKEYNLELSKNRVEFVKNELVSKFNVDPNMIKTAYVGDSNNIFGEAVLDRCVYVKF